MIDLAIIMGVVIMITAMWMFWDDGDDGRA